jgi:hypothetical protein
VLFLVWFGALDLASAAMLQGRVSQDADAAVAMPPWWTPLLPLAVAETARGVLVGLAWLPAIDLGMRFIQRDAAAFGFWCLLSRPSDGAGRARRDLFREWLPAAEALRRLH